MKHLLSIIAALFLLLNITNAQTESYNTRTINGKPYVIYQIKTGDTWASIAEKFGITERSLIDGNKQTNGTLKNVITLKVPMENSTKNITSNTAAKEAPVEVNSLPKIGENTNINNPKTNDIKILGKELRTEVKGANSLAVYKIGFGDNIYNIAKYYNCKVDDIKNLNNLISSSLTPGKIIKIPIKNSPSELPNVVNSSVVTTLQSEVEAETSAIINDTPTNIKPMVQQVTIEKEPTKTEIVTEPKIKVAVPTEKSNQTNGNYITRTIKGKDYIIYGIKAGDTWNSIAAKFGVSENRLKAENTQTYGNLKGAYTLKIPIDKNNNTPVNSEIKTETAVVNSDINKLEQEDSTIKNENDIPKINEVKAANNIDELKTEQEESTIQLKPNETIIGEYLVIKKIGKLYIKHLVISGEDLTRISKECYTTNSKIIAANNLSKTKLYTGQLLLIPTNKQILFKLTGLNYDEIEKKKNEAIIAENNKITNDVAKDADTDADTDSDDKTDTVIQTNATKTINTVAVKKYNWGDPIITKPTILDSNAKQTTIDLSKEINTNDIHANASKGETKDSYTHNVLKGETIASIAKKYKISTSDIANWNNLYQNRIRVGQDLIVNLERSKKPFVLINSISPESNKQIKNLDKSKNVRFVEEKGLCYLSNEKFIGVAHRNVPVGTLLLLTSTENYKKIYVRVTSILENSNVDVILQVDNNIAKQLAFNSTLTNVLLTYSLVE